MPLQKTRFLREIGSLCHRIIGSKSEIFNSRKIQKNLFPLESGVNYNKSGNFFELSGDLCYNI